MTSSWSEFRQDLARCRSGDSGLTCPICLRSEPEISISVGHIYPEFCRSTGAIVPECSNCNNNLGSTLDSSVNATSAALRFAAGKLTPEQIGKLFRHQMQVTGMGQRPARTVGGNIDGGRVGITLGYSDEPPKLHRRSDGQLEFKLDVEFGHSNQLTGGLLHSALLRTFSIFGYEAVLDPSTDMIQKPLVEAAKQSGDKKAAIRALRGFGETCRVVIDLPSDYNDLFLIRDTASRPLAFAFFLQYIDDRGGMATLPGPGLAGQGAYAEVVAGIRDPVILERIEAPSPESTMPLRGQLSSIFERPFNTDNVVAGFLIGSPDRQVSQGNLLKPGAIPIDFGLRPLRKKSKNK